VHRLSQSTDLLFLFLRPFLYRKKRNENADVFFGRKIKTPKNKKMRFLAPKNKKKTKFGRPLIQTDHILLLIL